MDPLEHHLGAVSPSEAHGFVGDADVEAAAAPDTRSAGLDFLNWEAILAGHCREGSALWASPFMHDRSQS